MKMINLWGYRLAYQSYGKGSKAVYKHSSHMCTIYDASYMCCIEITGDQLSIINMFKSITDPTDISVGNQL